MDKIKRIGSFVRVGFMIIMVYSLKIVDYRYYKMDKSIVWGIKGISDSVEIKRIGEWVLLFLPIILWSSIRMEICKRMYIMALPRYKYAAKWWDEICKENFKDILIYILFFTLAIGNGEYRGKDVMTAIALIFFNVAIVNMLFIVMCCLGLTLLNSILVTILTIGSGLIIGQLLNGNVKYNLFYWGMYQFSDLRYSKGFSIIYALIIESLLIIFFESIIRKKLFANYLLK